MKRVIALILAALMLVGTLALVACGNQTEENTTKPTSTTAATTAATTAVATEAENGTPTATTQGETPIATTGDTPAATTEGTTIAQTEATTQGGTTPSGENDGYSKLAGFEDVDFGGRSFLFVSNVDDTDNSWNTADEIFQESLNNTTPLTAAVYNRNTVMKNLYNCTITLVQEGGGGTLVSNDILSNTNTVDFYSQYYTVFNSGSANLYNAYSLDIDLTADGWNHNFVNSATCVDNNGNKKLFTLDGDFNTCGFRATWAVYCNLALLEQNFPDTDIFQLVRDHEWTIDKMIEMCNDVMQDDGDSTMTPGSEGDVFGMLTTAHHGYGLIASTGLFFTGTNEKGQWYCTADIMKANDAVNKVGKICEFFSQESVALAGYTQCQKSLQSGNTLFIGETMDVLRRMADDENANVTVLPCPLYSSEQTEYCSYMNTKGSTYFISKNACGGDKDMISDFWSLYAFHSYKIVRPAFVSTFAGLYCNASESTEMIETIIDGRVYDYAYYVSGFWGTLTGDITGDSHANNLAKMASKKAKEAQTSIDAYIENATKYGND